MVLPTANCRGVAKGILMIVKPGKICPLLFFLHRGDSIKEKSVYQYLFLESPARTIPQIAKALQTSEAKIREIKKRFETYMREHLWTVPAPFDLHTTSNAWNWRRYWHGKYR
jgi:hypothetical protein